MTVIGIDISGKTGLACIQDLESKVFEIDQVQVKIPLKDKKHYPQGLAKSAREMADLILAWVDARVHLPDLEVWVEDTNPGRSRAIQKFLEWTHLFVFQGLFQRNIRAKYIDSSRWRSLLDIRLTAEDKRNNVLVKKDKAKAKAEGVKGKVTVKHLSVRWANTQFGLNLIQKDNDKADALGVAAAGFLSR